MTLTGSKSVDGSIKNFVNDGAIPATVILAEAQAWIDERLRVREMLAIGTGTLTTSGTTATLPSDYIDLKTFNFTGTNAGKVKRARPEAVEENYGYDANGARVLAQPGRLYTDGTNFVFDYAADQSYPYRALYYGQSTPLGTGTGSATTNFLTSRYPGLVRAACMAAANAHRKDDAEKAYWEQKALAEVMRINQASDAEQWRDADMSMRPE